MNIAEGSEQNDYTPVTPDDIPNFLGPEWSV